MTWTTENDPPPPRPIPSDANDTSDSKNSEPSNVAEDDAVNGGPEKKANPDVAIDDAETNHFPNDGGATVDRLTEDRLEATSDANADLDGADPLDGDGPLDPAVFDGLFDDLSPEPDADADSPDTSGDLDDLSDSTENELQTPDSLDSSDRAADRWTMPSASPDIEPPVATENQSSPQDLIRPDADSREGNESITADEPLVIRPEAPERDSNNSVSLLDDPEPPTSETSQAKPYEAINFEDRRRPSLESESLAPSQPSPTTPSVRGPRSKWLGVLAAVALGSVLGLLGTFLIGSLRDSSDGDPTPQAQAEGQSDNEPGNDGVEQPTATGEPDSSAGEDSESAAAVQLPLSFGGDAIQFGPETSDLTDQDSATLDRLVEQLNTTPNAVATIAVRSYSTGPSDANFDLSLAQSEAISGYLVEAGISDDRFKVLARGLAPFGPSQPVDAFVVVNPGIGQSALKAQLGPVSPFSIGLEPGTSTLRSDSEATLDRVGEALTTIESARLTLAAYSFAEPDTETNKAIAMELAQLASNYLRTNHEIDEARISTIAPGAALYQIDSAWSSHVEIKIEDESRPRFEIASLDQSTLTFEPGTGRLTAEGEAFLDEVTNVLRASNATLVAEVFTFSADDRQSNLELSGAQAQAINDYLVANGVPDPQVRTSGGGAAAQFSAIGAPNSVALSVVD